MPVDEPSWWYGSQPSAMPAMLRPAAAVWGWAVRLRLEGARPHRCRLPVVCIGNFTAGGSGKTPLSIWIARRLLASGEQPAFLTRGYGGRIVGPHLVDLRTDTAAAVGDEPLLLARVAPTMVARDRASGATALDEAGSGTFRPTVIVMDDGLQNPGLAKDITIAVVDGTRGIGNGRVIPAGPLRAPLAFQLRLADAIVVNRAARDAAGAKPPGLELPVAFSGPRLEVRTVPDESWMELAGARVVGLCGIAGPDRFWRLLTEAGADVVGRITYPDHHAFSEEDALGALGEADRLQALLVTTEKDWVRLTGASGARASLRDRAKPLPITLEMSSQESERLMQLIVDAIARRRDARPS